jgi:DNA-binding transcriptional MerR regulator
MDDMVVQTHNGEQTERSHTQREELFPIRTVSSLTGVNSVTLRAWERRYRLIRPKRTGSGHRLYDQGDIDRIRHAVSLVDKGMSISQAARLIHHRESHGQALSDQQWRGYYQDTLEAIEALDETRLASMYGELFAAHPVQAIAARLIAPLMDALNSRDGPEDTSRAFFYSFLRNKLGARFHHRARTNTGPLLLCSLMPGEHDELELLLFALAAAEHNYPILMLGSFTSLNILTKAAERSRADAVVLFANRESLSNVSSMTKLNLLAQAERPVIVGGRSAEDYSEALADSDCIALPASLDEALQRLDTALNR